MAVRVADTLKQQNDLKTFPVAFSEDIWIDQNKGEGDANYKDLQTLYNEGTLGGSGLPEPETKDKLLLSTENAETSNLEWSQVDKYKAVEIPLYETKEAAEADIANLSDGQLIATKDEGNENAKPVDVVEKGNMHAVTSNAVADAISYSTNEVKTGGKWIDGKPIYRKTLVFTNQTLTDSPTHIGILDIPINNIVKTEELVLCKNTALAGSENEAVYADYRGYIYAYQKVSSTTTGWDIYYTIDYTKTTD